MVLAFTRDSTSPALLRAPHPHYSSPVHLHDSLCGQPSQTVQLSNNMRDPPVKIQHGPTTPNTQQPPPLTHLVWPPPLLATTTEYLLLRLRCLPPRSPPPYTRSMMVTQHNPALYDAPRIITLARQPLRHTQAATSFISFLMPRHPPNAQTKFKQTQKQYRTNMPRNQLYKSQTTHHTHPHQQYNTVSRLCGQPPHNNNGGRQQVLNVPDSKSFI